MPDIRGRLSKVALRIKLVLVILGDHLEISMRYLSPVEPVCCGHDLATRRMTLLPKKLANALFQPSGHLDEKTLFCALAALRATCN